MDEELRELISRANLRGSRYVKGETSLPDLPKKMAEMGVLLLSESNRIAELKSDRLREELNEIQNKLDDLRKAIFSNKLRKL